MVRLLVVGVGSMGWNHCRVCSELGILAGVSDPDHELMEKVSSHFGVPGFIDIEEALDQTTPDGVIVASPTSTHFSIAERVLEAGINVLVEKPLVSELIHGERLVSLSEENELILAVGHIERHNPVISRARTHLKQGDWGELITMNSRRVSAFSGRIMDVGAILDTGIHDIDNLIYLMDSNPVSVYATGGKINDIDHEDHANIVINFENGKSGVVEVNWITPMKVRTLSLTCDGCYVELDYIGQKIIISRSSSSDMESPRLFPPPIEFKSTKINLNKEEPLRLEIEDFISSIKSRSPPLVDGKQALISLRTALAAVESLNSGEVVKIE